MENINYGRRREGRWTPIRAKAQDTRANRNSWETHLVSKRWDIRLLRALSPRTIMMMMIFSRARWSSGWRAGLPIERFWIQIPARVEIWFEISNKISAPPAPPSQLGYDECTDHTLSVGR